MEAETILLHKDLLLLPYDVVDGLQVVDEVRVVGGAVVALVAPDELAPRHVVVHDGALRGGEPAVVALLVVVRLLDVVVQLEEEAGLEGALGAPLDVVRNVVRTPEVLVHGLLIGGLVLTAKASFAGGGAFQCVVVILVIQNVDRFRADWGDLCCFLAFAHLDICTLFARLGIDLTLVALELA